MSMTEYESIGEILGQNSAKYMTIASMAVLIYDYCLTFESEVKLIWDKKWNTTRIIFTFSRYLPFAGATMTTYGALKNRAGQDCHQFNVVSNALHIIAIASAEALLVVRTFAFWRQSRPVLYFLMCFACFCVAGAVGFASLANSHLHAPTIDPSGCIFEASRTTAIQYAFLILFELVLLGLNVYQRLQFCGSLRGSLIARLYYDGLLYMGCIISVTASNIIICAFADLAYTDLMDLPQLVSHSVLASRIFFNLRKSHQAEFERDFGADVFLSEIAMAEVQSLQSNAQTCVDDDPHHHDVSIVKCDSSRAAVDFHEA